MSGLADWRALPGDWTPPSYDRRALLAANRWWGDLQQYVFSSPLLRRIPTLPTYDSEAIRRLFNFGESHCFDVPPHAWAKFHEPQITAGLVHFLNAGSGDRQLSRALAFYDAACSCTGRSFTPIAAADVVDFDAIAEEPTATKREKRGRKRVQSGKLDVLVHFELADGARCGVALEAKFDHSLSKGQLEKYLKHLEAKRRWNLDKSALILVARRPASLGPKSGWLAVTWWQFLTRFERAIADHDDDEFKRFRRTIWETAYGR